MRTPRPRRRGTAAGRPAPRAASRPRAQGRVVAAVSLGGGAGAAARYGATLWWPTPPDAFPWTLLWVNAAGSAALGALMALLAALPGAHPLLRPFLGPGFLGGFTTFSAYAADVERLAADGRAGTGLAALALPPLAGLASAWLAAGATRASTRALARAWRARGRT